MLEKVSSMLLQSLLGNDNATIKKGESLVDFLNSFSSEKLFRFMVPYVSIDASDEEVDKYEKIKDSKDEIIDYIMNNFEGILQFYFAIFEKNELEFLNELVLKNGNITYNISNPKVSLKFVLFMKEFAFSKVYFDIEKEEVTIFIPDEYVNVFKSAFENSELLKKNDKFNNIIDTIIGMTVVYAIIPFNDMYDMLKEFFDVSKDEILYDLELKNLIDDTLTLNIYKDDIYISSIEFRTPRQAHNFYKSTKGKYNKFSFEEFLSFKNDTYLESMSLYNELCTYLTSNFESKNVYDFKICKMFLIQDFLFGAQLDEKRAKEKFLAELDEFFIINDEDKMDVYKLMKRLYDDFPKWIKRGNR